MPLELLQGFSARFDGGLFKPFVEPLMKLSSLVRLSFDGRLTLKARVDAGRSVEVTVPAERSECPKRNPPLKASAHAFGVFDETARMLRRVRGSESVRVKVRAADGALIVEPPRRVFRAGVGVEPVEVRVQFGDLKEALSFFEAAVFAPSTLQFGESVLVLEAVCGGMKLRALVAGQLELG